MNGLSGESIDSLLATGYSLSLKFYMGDVNAVLIDPQTGEVAGSHDLRHEF